MSSWIIPVTYRIKSFHTWMSFSSDGCGIVTRTCWKLGPRIYHSGSLILVFKTSFTLIQLAIRRRKFVIIFKFLSTFLRCKNDALASCLHLQKISASKSQNSIRLSASFVQIIYLISLAISWRSFLMCVFLCRGAACVTGRSPRRRPSGRWQPTWGSSTSSRSTRG